MNECKKNKQKKKTKKMKNARDPGCDTDKDVWWDRDREESIDMDMCHA